jgi:hypothetical protein
VCRVRALLLVLLVQSALGGEAGYAQGDIAPEFLNRPPRASPTSRIDVGAIPIVLSGSQEAEHFASGLLQGLMVGNGLRGIGLIVVTNERIMVQLGFGTMTPDTRFPTGAMSGLDAEQAETSLNEMGRLARGLLNGGKFEEQSLLPPDIAIRMLETERRLHPALPGWTSVFAEMFRNGWRALQIDGTEEGFASRFVVVPELRLAYFLVAEGEGGLTLWRTLDHALFDRLMPPRPISLEAFSGLAPPSAGEARGLVGAYESVPSGLYARAALKTGYRLEIRADDSANLILSGAESVVLAPRMGGFWSSSDGNYRAVSRDGWLILNTDAYRSLALYKRPLPYVLLAFLAVIGAAGWTAYRPGQPVMHSGHFALMARTAFDRLTRLSSTRFRSSSGPHQDPPA